MSAYDTNALHYLNGYLEFVSGLNSSLSGNYNYSFGMEEVDDEKFELPATRRPIRFTQFQQAAAKWFMSETKDTRLHDALEDAAENLLDMIEIELLRNKLLQFYATDGDADTDLFILESDDVSFWVEFAKEEKE